MKNTLKQDILKFEIRKRDQDMTLQQELSAFYKRCGFGPVLGKRPLTVSVYTGCMLVPLPNIEVRHIYLKYHDLHHLMTGFSVGRIGEGEVSAWELGSGSFYRNPILGVMNFIALSTGLALQPKRMWKAFLLGCQSQNLYAKKTREKIDRGDWKDVASLQQTFLNSKQPKVPKLLRQIEFAIYALISSVIHAVIVLPALLLRFFTDAVVGKSIFKAIKPVKRSDLY